MKGNGPELDKIWLEIPYRESNCLRMGQDSQARAVRITTGGRHNVEIVVNGESNDKPCNDSSVVISIKEGTL